MGRSVSREWNSWVRSARLELMLIARRRMVANCLHEIASHKNGLDAFSQIT